MTISSNIESHINLTMTISPKSVKGKDDLKVRDRGRQQQSTASTKAIWADDSSWV